MLVPHPGETGKAKASDVREVLFLRTEVSEVLMVVKLLLTPVEKVVISTEE